MKNTNAGTNIRPMQMIRYSHVLLYAVLLVAPVSIHAIDLQFSKNELESRWAHRIKNLLGQGKLPLIDMQTSMKPEQVDSFIPDSFSDFDEYGIAIMSVDGYQRPKDGSKGYRWSHYTLNLVNQYPDYFVPTANGGTNKNWLQEKGGKSKHFIDQMEEEIYTGKYYSMGELDFRHYMSNSQCKKGRVDRDSDIPLNGENGHRIFQLSSDTDTTFVIHLEPEDDALDALEEMLQAYPKAKVIVAHFGQIRHPERQKRFTPDYVRHLLSSYSNLYYDLAVGYPNRKYVCAGPNNDDVLEGDTIIWYGAPGAQENTLKAGYITILKEFSNRFVFASDYGGGRFPLPEYLSRKTQNFHQIIKDLPEEAKHNIAYKNAWRILTGRSWGS